MSLRRAPAVVLAALVVLSFAPPARAGSVAGATSHTVLVTPAGTVWTWGANTYGQLGDGTTTARPTPIPVPGLTGVVAVAAGQFHTLALTSDGTVWAWGANGSGQLGDGTTTPRFSPVVAG